MEKYFNTEGVCNPEEHYMANLVSKLCKAAESASGRKKSFIRIIDQ